MTTRKTGVSLGLIGILGILASILVDFVGIGKGGIQSAQILGILSGLLIAVVGFSLALQTPDKNIELRSSLSAGIDRVLGLPVSFWFLIGFLIVYILLFLSPVFFNIDRRMAYFYKFLPDKYPIGIDMQFTLDHVRSWVTTKQSPYPASHYPPLTYILLSPLTLFEYPISYTVSTYLTLFSYIFLTIAIPALLIPKKGYLQVALLSITGLFSYGFLFELERGQYYSITFLLCMLAILIFHRHYEFRFLAYVLFSISVHLKIVPIFFLPMFIKDWRDWKANIKRMIGLGLLNAALLFVLGYQNFVSFIMAIRDRVETPTFLWNGNHSLGNFVFNFVKDGFGLLSQETILVLQQNAKVFEWVLLGLIFICFLSIVLHMYQNGLSGFNSYLLLTCTLCALVIPVSVDYTLPMLIPPMAILLNTRSEFIGSIGKKIVSILLVLITSIAYTSLLFPFKYKPYYLNNSFPALFIILLAVTMLYFLQEKNRTVLLQQIDCWAMWSTTNRTKYFMTNNLPINALDLAGSEADMDAQIDLTIVVPCLNEVENIIVTLDNIYLTLKDQSFTYEIIVVDDISEDETFAVANKWAKQHKRQIPIKVVKRSLHRRGYGAVVRYGTAYGSGQYCIFVSADNVDPVHLIPQLYKEVINGAILAQCSRYIRSGDDSTIPFSYKFYQFFFRIGVRIALGHSIPDSTYAFKMFRRRDLLGVGLSSNRFNISPEITFKSILIGGKIAYVPGAQGVRKGGKSKFIFHKEGLGYGYCLIRAFLHRHRIIYWF